MINLKVSEEAIIQGRNYRFTVLTPSLIRMEYSKKGEFVDKATQMVVNRNFDLTDFRIIDNENGLQIITSNLRLEYNKKEFSAEGLKIDINGNYACYSSIWHYGDEPRDLKGTAKTLDEADGEVPLERGILSMEGWSLLNDKGSLILGENGWVNSRKDTEVDDIYFFGYGRNYIECLKDFYHLTGEVPLLPKYALGNWWSRYYRYTEKSYLELMNRFEKENIPFTVSVIDMDWHITEVDPKYGTGWTGYTWNKDLFPNPERFMKELHDKGMKVTLNVHPADGVRAFEDCYKPFAEYMGIDVSNEDPIKFQIGNQKFLNGYFNYVHHPLEEQGVDFWWIDWQQGNNSGVEGVDPLWMLNHYHYLDNQRNSRRGLIFSRYSGPGSHRYPVGFSGDSIISWKSLEYQPYFTANASNIGYGWWSHDIGGHMHGVKDDELAVRWLQFGVFSPIMRFHSSSSEFNGKEPWRYNLIAEKVMKYFLRLRHRMIPYLNSMNYRASLEGIPLIQPMYYHNPSKYESYQVPNEYYFGSEMIVCPITSPTNKATGMAKFSGWLPDGNWMDLFTGLTYVGGRKIDFYRKIDNIPVLAKEGSIIPLDGRKEGNNIDNPEFLEIHIISGKSGEFVLKEDEGVNISEEWSETLYSFNYEEKAEFIINEPTGNISILPEERRYKLVFRGINNDVVVKVYSGLDELKDIQLSYNHYISAKIVYIPLTNIKSKITVQLENVNKSTNQINKRIFDFLNESEIEFDLKNDIFNIVSKIKESKSIIYILGELQSMNIKPEIMGPLNEILLASEFINF